ncbi:MAG: hypothetical protein B6D35_11830 [Candidatus Brocadia sp. UTAMX2]|nr:MAG: hypothetical protein B6D35_11830 [Candidatus Brocadia sp. UTAMX2]
MIPIRDRNPSGTVPVVTASIILTNVLVFFIQLSLGDQLELFLFHFGIVPMKIVYSSEIPDSTFINTYLPFLSYMFLHGGFVHLIGNMWYLWIFGNNIEDQLGHIRFVLFYFICGIGAAIVHVYSNRACA